MYQKVKSMLPDACCLLGMKSVKDIDTFTTLSVLYLSMDREHYIEFENMHAPEGISDPPYAVIGRLLPIARKVITQKEDGATLTETRILHIMTAQEGTWYVTSHEIHSHSDDPEECYWTDPVYRCVSLEKIDPTMEIMEPSKLIPPATPLGRDIFGMLFTAVAHCAQHLDIHLIPRITERVMRSIPRREEKTLVVDGKEETGLLIRISSQGMEEPLQRADHNFLCSTFLCLFIGQTGCRYVMETEYDFCYFAEEDESRRLSLFRTVYLHELRGSFRLLFY